MFINYVAAPSRSTPLNLAVARILLSLYVIWRVGSINAGAIAEWPVMIHPFTTYLYPAPEFEWILVVEKWLLLLLAASFIVGYRTRICTYLIGLGLAHLTGAMMVLNRSGETQQMAIAVLLVLIFGLYAEQDELSIDGFRRTRTLSSRDLNVALENSDRGPYRADALRYMLLTLGILYAGSAWAKIDVVGLLTWTNPESLARHIRYYEDLFHGAPLLGEYLLRTPHLLAVATWGTLLVEAGFLLVILAGVSVTLIILLLFGMHAGIYLVMGIFFFDLFVFLGLFAAFDRGHARLSSDREIAVVYDEQSYLCPRLIYLITLLDANNTVTCYPQTDAQEEVQFMTEGTVEDEISVFADGESYDGYSAFCELLRQFWMSTPIVRVLAAPPVEKRMKRLYQYFASHPD